MNSPTNTQSASYVPLGDLLPAIGEMASYSHVSDEEEFHAAFAGYNEIGVAFTCRSFDDEQRLCTKRWFIPWTDISSIEREPVPVAEEE